MVAAGESVFNRGGGCEVEDVVPLEMAVSVVVLPVVVEVILPVVVEVILPVVVEVILPVVVVLEAVT